MGGAGFSREWGVAMLKSGWGRRALLLGCAVLLLFAEGEGAAAGTNAETERLVGSGMNAETERLVRANESRPKLNWADMQRRYRGAFILSAPGRPRQVALTFDDVPDPRFTPQVLDILKEKRVHATFFVVGMKAAKHPGLVKRIHAEGHAIGNHSFSHPDFSRLSTRKMVSEIERTGAIIRKQIGFVPKLIRPPYGEITEPQLKWAISQGYTVVNWNVDSLDWRQLQAPEIIRNVTEAVRPGSIILLHAGGGVGQDLSGTVEALPRLIDWLRAKGYEPVALTEMLAVPESGPRIRAASWQLPFARGAG